jgi:ABC-type branched-chain amino acid transport systems, ATPase component
MSLLSVQNINTGYDKKQVLFDISLEVEKGETILLIGANGSGKSTLLKAIYGILPLWEGGESKGKIIYEGKDITNISTNHLIKKGLMYIPQKNELFEDMTVAENLKMSTLFLSNSTETKKRLEDVFEKNSLLKDRQKQIVNRLSGGERKQLSLGMILMNRPKLLLYDEPLAGLSGNNIEYTIHQLTEIKEAGTTIIIVEHRIKELILFADKVIGLKLGYMQKDNLTDLEKIKMFLV